MSIITKYVGNNIVLMDDFKAHLNEWPLESVKRATINLPSSVCVPRAYFFLR